MSMQELAALLVESRLRNDPVFLEDLDNYFK